MKEITTCFIFLCVVGFADNSHSNCLPCPNGTTGGIINSPGYPDDDTTKAPFDCAYKLSAVSGHSVRMTLATGANSNSLAVRINIPPAIRNCH